MTPRYIITKERANVPEGFRNLTEQEIAKQFLKLDVDKDYFISKNEWMLNCLKLWDMENMKNLLGQKLTNQRWF